MLPPEKQISERAYPLTTISHRNRILPSAVPGYGRAVMALLFIALVACSEAPAPIPASTTDASAFTRFLDTAYAADMRALPQTAKRRGVGDNNRDWNAVSEDFRKERRELAQTRLDALQTFDQDTFSDDQRLSWQLFQQVQQRSIASDEFRHERYVIHQHRGAHTQVPSFLINVHKIGNQQDAEDYIARLRNIGPLFDQVIEQLRIREQKGLFLPDWSYPKMIESSRNTLVGQPFSGEGDSLLWTDFNDKLDAIELAPATSEKLRQEAREALVEIVGPAYTRLIEEFEHQAALAPAQDGVWKFPRGEEFYAERLRFFTTTDLNAEQIHAIGLREVARIHAEMRAIMAQVEFEGDLAEFMRFMREDDQFYYANDNDGRQQYLAQATALIDDMRTRLPEVFGLLPQADVVVYRVEPFRERAAGKAFYQAPPADGSRPGIYYANLYDMDSMPIYQMEALAYHEGIPGHHMQRAISIELQGVPEFQKYATFTAFTEGWGLYSEYLPLEMGYYSDPYSNFGRLSMELWRAARLVVDTGIHSKRWTREEAIAYLVANTPNSEYDATKAIERYSAMPGQATAYMIGKLKILELRQQAAGSLGDDFDIRAFHDEVLKDGPVPLSILETKIKLWIERQQSARS